ncbi:MAG: LamG-like jellyroll fold domain-containing protein [Rhodopirellula bahusiensis]
MLAQWNFNDLSGDGVVTESVSGNNLTIKHSSESGFTASKAALTLAIDENTISGSVVGSVSGQDAEREARIASLLAADANLRYSAETGKFYELIHVSTVWTTAQSSANSNVLGGVSGQLLTIGSAAENELATSFANQLGGDVWLGYSDQVIEGDFQEYTGNSAGKVIWRGTASGYRVDDAYSNWAPAEPNDDGGQDFGKLYVNGTWDDEGSGTMVRSIVEWNADAVLDATDAVTYTIQSQTVAGAFTIDASTGEITVADGSLLDFETNAAHSLTVRVTDEDSNTYDEVFTVSLNDLAESNNAPSDLSSGIELNTDGGNDAYLQLTDGSPVLGGLGEVTFEASFQVDSAPSGYIALIDYWEGGIPNEFTAGINADGTLFISIADSTPESTTQSFTELLDGEQHHFAVSWDQTSGNVRFYVDGQFVETITGRGTGHTLYDNPAVGLIIGQDADDAGDVYAANAFQGTLYDVRIWDQVRSDAEISLNYQNKFDSGSLPTGLVANWQMDGFNGSSEVVDVVSGNNLSVGHAVGTGLSSSTPVDDLHVAENATDGTSVGYVLPSDPDVSNDIADDGLFLDAADPGSYTRYTTGQSLGGWTVESGNVDLLGSIVADSPLGGRSVELNGDAAGSIVQSLSTEVGRQYQVIFNAAGIFSGGAEHVDFRVSAGGVVDDVVITEGNGWSLSNPLPQPFSLTFTADSTTTDLRFASLISGSFGAAIADVQVIEIPAAVTTILNDDPTLSYDAGTGKFYKLVTNAVDVTTAMSSASSDLINGVGGQLVTIRSSYENELVQDIVSRAGSEFYIGGTDATSEGNWNWIEDGVEADNFWVGDELGAAPAGVYANFNSIEPNDFGGNEDYLAIYGSTGEWLDISGADNRGYIIEWNASEVLSNFTFSLNDDAGGRFAIDSNTGEITVVDGSLLNHEASVSHNIDVTVSDAAGNSFNETMTVAVDDVSEAPTDLSVGVALNSDGGNDAYLVDNSSGVPYWDGLTGITMEFAISDLQTPTDMATLYSRQSGGSGSYLAIHADGTLDWNGFESTATYSQLFDGDLHTVAFSWDTPGGELRFYVDGVFAESIVTGTQANTNGGGAFVLGQDQDGGAESGFDSAQHFSGTFHDVRVWDHVRADSDIADHDNYKLDFTSADAASAGLLANWQFDGFLSGEIVDIANGYVLTVGHATGTGYVAGAARDTLAVDELASNGTQVGFAVAHDADSNDTFNYTLLDTAGGRFAIDLNTGEITVADGSLLDFETTTSHDVTVQVMDSSGSTYNETVAITVNDVNDAPVMSPYTPTYNTTEDSAAFSASISTLLGSSVSDVDSGAVEGIAVYAQSGNAGNVEFSINGGSSWQMFSSLSETNATLLRSTDLFRFTPDGSSGGTMTLDYYAWDQTEGTAGSGANVSSRGGTTAYSTTDDTVTINVSDINDEQTVSTNNGATFNEGSAGNTITSSMLETTDVDNTASELTYTVTANPSYGQLKLDGLVTTSFTQSEIDAGRITYDHDDSENLADSFSFSVDDGAGSASTGSFSITLNPINDNIVAITSDGGGTTASVNVNETVSFVTQVTVSDADMPGDTMTYSITGGTDQNDFTIDASGNLTLVSSPDFESPDDSDLDNVYEVTVQVSDGVYTDSQTITVTVQDVQSTLLNVTTTSDVDDTGLGATYTIEELYAVGGGTDGEVSLREAITAANGTLGQDTINFSILNSDAGYTGTDGVDAHWQISLTASLPTITESVILDGTSQTVFGGDVNPGTLGVSNEAGTNDQTISSVERPEIAIIGASGFDGLVVGADNVTVQGFAMYGFSSDAAIYISDAVINAVIDSNAFGVAATSIADLGAALNNQIHVQSVGADNGILSNNILAYSKAAAIHASNASDGWSITGNQFVNSGFNYSNGDAIAMNGSTGGTVDGNYIAGSSTQAILLSGSTSGVTITDNTIVGNGVGPSSGSEVQFDAIAFRSGTNDITLRHNIIADNYGAGITVNDGAYDIEITENSIYGNGTVLSRQGTASTGSIGIDLQASGDDIAYGTAPYYTANDAGDADTGGNSLQNFPVITQAVSDGTQIAISGTFNSTANETFTIELFTSASYANGYGQGETFLGSVSVTTDGSGNATFNTTLFTEVESGDLITATATNDTTKETSEFAAQFAINGPVYANDDDRHLEFDGTDDYVAIASSPELVMTNTMTMEAWVRPDASANTDRMIINKEGEYELSIDADASIKWGFDNTDPGWAWHDTNHVLTEGEWAHVAVTYDNGTVTTYVNGDVVDVYEGSGAIDDAHPTMDELHIGGRSNNPAGQYFQGGIDDVRIWDVARSQDEIRATIDTPPSGSATGLVANYRFDESGTTVTDYSGEGNDGVLGGGTASAEPTRSTYTLSEDATLVVSAANGLLANDADTDGDSITITEINGISGDVGTTVTLASGATVQLNADGSFDFDPGTVYQGLNDGETATDTFTYTISDGNGNTDIATTTITTTGINDAPGGSDNTITIDEDNSHTFTLADFGYSDIEGDQFEFVHIDTLPGSGRLLYNGSAVTATDDVHYNDINSGLLTYEPVADENGSGYASFTFRVQDDGGTANSGSDIDPVANTITFDVTAQNDVADFLADNEITNSDFVSDASAWTLNDNVDWDSGAIRFGQVGGANGSITQTFTTVIGETYYLTFDYGDYSGTLDQTLDVDVVGGSSLLTKSIQSGVAADAKEAYTFRFTADSTSTTLTFTDTSADHSGVRGYLDNVEVRSTTIPTETATAYTENDSATVITTKIDLGDIDDSDIESATVQVTANFATGEDILAATDQYGITSSYDSGTGTLTLSGTASLAEYETVLQSVTYANSSDAPDTSTRTISYIVNDGDGNSVAITHDVTVTAVNDAPVLDNSGNLTLTNQTEDAGAPSGAVGTVITDLVSLGGNVTDADGSPQTGIAITSAATTNGTWLYTTDSGTNWIALGTVSDSSARVLEASSDTRIYFQSDSNFDGTVSDAITFRAWDRTVGSNGSLQDASTNGGTTAFSSATETADITVNSIENAPIISGGPATSSLTETDSGLTDTGTFTVSDADVADEVTAAVNSVAVSGTGASSVPGSLNNATLQSYLSVSPTAILDGTETSDTLTWNFNSGSEAFDFLADGETLVLTYTVSATDDSGSTLSDTETVTVTITGTNDGPIASVDSGTSTESGGIANATIGSDATGNVLDNDTDADVTESLTVVGVAAGSQGSASGSVASNVVGTFGTIQIASNGSYTFVVDQNNASVQALRTTVDTLQDVFTYTIEDSNEAKSTAEITITIQGANDNPHDLATTGLTVVETANNGTSAGTITHSDIDSGDTATFTLTDDANGRFSIDPNTGEVTVADSSQLDNETDTTHNITVRVTDTAGSTYDETFVVTITDANEHAVSTPTDSDAAANEVDENSGQGIPVGITADAFDLDSSNNTITYSLTANPGNLFQIDSSTGEVTVAGSVDRESSASYDITVTATSDDTSTASQSFTININDVNEFVVVANGDVDGNANQVNENSAAGVSVGVTVLATDFDATNSSVQYAMFDDAGGRFDVDLNSGVVTVAAGASLDFEANSSHDVIVRGTSDDGTFVDQTFTIQVADINEAPVALDDGVYTVVVGQDTLLNSPHLLANDVDVDSDPLRIVIVAHPANGTLQVDLDGNVTYTPNSGYFGDDTFSYQADDGLLTSNIATVTIDVLGGSTGGSSGGDGGGDSGGDSGGSTGSGDGGDGGSDSGDAPTDSTGDGDADGTATTVGPGGSSGTAGNESTQPGRDNQNANQGDGSGSESGEDSSGGGTDARGQGIRASSSQTSRGAQRFGFGDTSFLYEILDSGDGLLNDLAGESELNTLLTWHLSDSGTVQINESFDNEEIDVGAVGTTLGLASIGYVLWALRGGMFIATMYAGIPSWRMLDPASLLSAYRGADGMAQDKVEEMLD